MVNEFAVTEEYQAKILALMLNDLEFKTIASASLDKEVFTNKALQWFFDKLSLDDKNYTDVILQEELVRSVKDNTIKENEISKFVYIYDIIKKAPVPAEVDDIKAKLSTFIKTQSVKKAILDSAELAKQERWEEITDLVADAVSSGIDLEDNGINYFQEVEQRVEDRASQTKRRKVATGIPELDEYLYGGIKNRQTGLIVGGTGRGKSVFLQWLCRTAILTGKRCVYFTFELDAEDIADRFDAMFSKTRPQELNFYKDQVLQELSKYADTFKDSLIIKHYPADSATVHTLKAFIRRLSHAGMPPDLIVVDYIDLLAPHRTYRAQHEEQDAVMKALIGLAQEYDLSTWTATQLNRSGLSMETPDESSMAGYIGRQYSCDIALWMAQTNEEREDERMRLWISKSRNGPAGRVISLSTNYRYMEFYRDAEQQQQQQEEIQEKQEEVQNDDGVSGERSLQQLLESKIEERETSKVEDDE